METPTSLTPIWTQRDDPQAVYTQDRAGIEPVRRSRSDKMSPGRRTAGAHFLSGTEQIWKNQEKIFESNTFSLAKVEEKCYDKAGMKGIRWEKAEIG